MKLYVDDEPLLLGTAELESYERSLDFRDGVLRRKLVWRTPAGKRVRIELDPDGLDDPAAPGRDHARGDDARPATPRS